MIRRKRKLQRSKKEKEEDVEVTEKCRGRTKKSGIKEIKRGSKAKKAVKGRMS